VKAFENRVLRRGFRLKRSEMTGGWKILNNEELNNVTSSPNIIRIIKLRRIKMDRLCSTRRRIHAILVGKPKEK
jgi:hypothetical protein